MKNKRFAFIYYLLQFTWALPLNIIAGLIFVFYKMKHCPSFKFEKAFACEWNGSYSMGLGCFIFISKSWKRNSEVLVHEYGHTIQSMMLGPLYLVIIALPSVIWARSSYFAQIRRRKRIHYHDLYCEKWANECGYKQTGKQGIQF